MYSVRCETHSHRAQTQAESFYQEPRGGAGETARKLLSPTETRLLHLSKGRSLQKAPHLFIVLGLYSGLRREEILALQWDCVFLDEPTPYISVRRAWRTEHNRPVISTTLKTKAARRDIPIPKCLVDCLREVKETSVSEYVICDRSEERRVGKEC